MTGPPDPAMIPPLPLADGEREKAGRPNRNQAEDGRQGGQSQGSSPAADGPDTTPGREGERAEPGSDPETAR